MFVADTITVRCLSGIRNRVDQFPISRYIAHRPGSAPNFRVADHTFRSRCGDIEA